MTQIAPTPTDTVRQRYRDPVPVDAALWNPVLQVLHDHRSVRRYLPDPVSDDVLRLLVSAAQSAATSSNLQVWSVVAVRDPERKARLAALAGGQAHIEQAPVLLVWTADFARLRQLAADREAPLEGADYLESSYVGFIDAALAAQNAVVAAESLGLGTVYIGALRNHPERVAAEIGLPPSVFAVFGLVVGHPDPAEEAKVKPRLPQAAVLHHETYDLPAQREHVADYETRIADFYAEQNLAHSWTERVLARLASPRSLNGRDRLRESLATLGFPLR
ncbi:NADPH-dependent oxidoreductase [Nocardia puris]|uniref:Nitroreductase n=1 Tax=Nocardia puris TaxID=208602 RepID=A0A366DUC2_9NOCA|nr:NADPH-dependent oxidoreductase [Nocardia puris]MBF6210271.1 NADPH-dependent oxidoreductase [Nocardia puris]MBF6367347.1 NADPH-dependent oxidoreductase [Nocardia puris]MBF6457532.1 NADPH-dependent oxidoreductase [Nocardia puris]RBO93690.1 nitroreductase [Nocardia puris]